MHIRLQHKITLIALFSLVNTRVFAQNLNISPYSAYGVGLIEQPGTFVNRLLGSTGIAASPAYDQSYVNPAQISNITHTTFNLGMHSSFQNIQEGSLSGTNQNTRFSYAYLALPIQKNRMGLMVGLEPYSSAGYLSVGDFANSITTTTQSYWAEGGLNKLNISLAKKWQIDSTISISIGASYLYYFGSIEKTKKISFALPNTLPYTSKEALVMRGSGLKFGLYVEKWIGKDQLHFGLGLQPQTHIGTKQDFLSTSYKNNNISDIIDTIAYRNNDRLTTQLPLEVALGVAYTIKRNTQISISYTQADWSSVLIADQANFIAASQLGLGLQVKLNQKVEQAPTLYFGTSLATTNLQLNDAPVKKQSFASGINIPLAQRTKSNTSLLFGIEIVNYQSAIPSYKENHINLLFGVSLTPGIYDQWFKKPQYD